MDLTNYYEGLSSQRFFYRKVSYDDAQSWMEFYDNNPCLKYLDFDYNRPPEALAHRWIRMQIERYDKNAFGHLGIISKATNELVGRIGFKLTEHCVQKEIEKTTAIKPAYWRQGVGREATITLINAAFKNGWAESVIGVRHIDNISSGKFNYNLGFKDTDIIQTSTRLVVKYRLTKTDWEKKRDYYYPTTHPLLQA